MNASENKQGRKHTCLPRVDMQSETKLVPFSVLYKPKRQNHFKTKTLQTQATLKKGKRKKKRIERKGHCKVSSSDDSTGMQTMLQE